MNRQRWAQNKAVRQFPFKVLSNIRDRRCRCTNTLSYTSNWARLMLSPSWYRVAKGFQMVAEAASSRTTTAAGSAAARCSEHGIDLARNARVAAERGSVAWNQANMHGTAASAAEAVPSVDLHLRAATSSGIAEADGSGSPIEAEGPLQARTPIAPQGEVSSKTPSPTATDDAIRPIDDATTLQEGSAVPSTRIGRAFGFASLGVGLAAGTAVEAASRVFLPGDSAPQHSMVASDANADRLAEHLCRMRGAALKLGQMLSMQDEAFLAPPLARALARARGSADAMPKYQLEAVLNDELGNEWRDKMETFEELPFAAASVGQVHRASIRSDSAGSSEKLRVAMKVQYPGVADSIDSDLNNLTMLVKATGLAPPGLFIDEVIRVGRLELKEECDYVREAENQRRFRDLVMADAVLSGPECKLSVPRVISNLSTSRVLTTEMAPGGTVDKVSNLDQEERNRIGRAILRLTMRELFVWRFMQTDPNWGNFLYDVGTGTTHLIDFGAAREYSKAFVDGYLRIVKSASERDADTLMEASHRMGFLTGEENGIMLEAHKMSGFTVGEPFATDGPYDFGRSGISARLSDHSSAFLQHRLTPPPEEVYTLHRKLAGAFNLCIKLGSIIRCRDLLDEVWDNYVFEDE